MDIGNDGRHRFGRYRVAAGRYQQHIQPRVPTENHRARPCVGGAGERLDRVTDVAPLSERSSLEEAVRVSTQRAGFCKDVASLSVSFQYMAGGIEGDPAEPEALDRFPGEHGIRPLPLECNKTAKNASQIRCDRVQQGVVLELEVLLAPR